MKREIRNPKSHRYDESNRKRTEKVAERYYGKLAILLTWEKMPDKIQIENHDYLLGLRRTVRTIKNYLLNRNDAKISV